MSEKELFELIKKGESDRAEFKSSLADINEIVEDVSGFSNSKGGKILIGISNSGKILGIEIGKDTVERLTNKIVSNTEPRVYPSITVTEIDKKKVIVIEVQEAEEKPVLAFGRGFKRVGKSTVRMSKEEIERMILEGKKVYWDSLICEEASLGDIDEEKVRLFLKKSKVERRLEIDEKIPVKEALKKLELLKDGKLTNAAILLFGKNPQRFFFQAETRCARFKGITPVEFTDMKVFGGSLIDQVENAVSFVLDHIPMRVVITGKPEREEIYEYPPFAIREAIVNAICHRDYTIMSNVQVRIFDDRIEVWGCGPLPEPLSIGDLKRKHESILRNPLIGKCFFLIKFIEQWGTGTNRMIESCLKHSLPEPEFELVAGNLVVTFWKDIYTEDYLKKMGLNEREIKAVMFVKKEEKITNKIYQELFGVSRQTATRELSNITQKGIFRQVGVRGKGTFYTLAQMTHK
jgi:ATP-dependent DNA helicase RecG